MARELNGTGLASDANLQGYWRLESDGTDSSSNEYDLTAVNAPSHTTGKFGNCVDLESTSSQYYTIADASSPDLEIAGDLSVVFWVKPETSADMPFVCLAGSGEDASDNILYFVRTDSSSKLQIVWEYGDGSNETVTTSTSDAITTGSWQHIVVVRDVSENKVTFYIDGSSEDVSYTNDATGGTDTDFFIGSFYGQAIVYDGLIDDVAVFDRVLTSNEVQNLVAGSFSPSISPSTSPSASSSLSPSPSPSVSPSASLSPSVSPSVSPSPSPLPSVVYYDSPRVKVERDDVEVKIITR